MAWQGPEPGGGPASHGIHYHHVCELHRSAGHPHLNPSCYTEEEAGARGVAGLGPWSMACRMLPASLIGRQSSVCSLAQTHAHTQPARVGFQGLSLCCLFFQTCIFFHSFHWPVTCSPQQFVFLGEKAASVPRLTFSPQSVADSLYCVGICGRTATPQGHRAVIFFFSLNFYLLINLFLAVLGLRFCARAFSSCGERGPLFIAVRGPLTIAASPVAEHRLQTRRLSNVAHGPSCSTVRGILPDQGPNPCALHWQADSQPPHHQGSPRAVI